MMSSKVIPIADVIESHKPKHFKYRYIISDDSVYDELLKVGYNMDNLDTINDDELVHVALEAHYTEYGRDIIKDAKTPTIMDDGIILSKKLITKTDAKLKATLLGFFKFNNLSYIAIKFRYERFDILEIFVLT